MEQRTRRTVKACVICHKKKVRCDIDIVEGNSCTNCVRDDYECVPRERKRKRYTISTSPPATTSRTTRAKQAAEDQRIHEEDAHTTNGNGVSIHENGFREGRSQARDDIRQDSYTTPSTGLASEHNIDPSLHNYGSGNTPVNASYLGRLEYIRNDVPVNDEGTVPDRAPHRLSETDLEIMRVQRVSELPPRAIRESLLDAFWTRCYPWTPVVERHWVEDQPSNNVSLLLLHAMLLAGSRVSSVSPGYSPEDFYKKARVLFWMGAEEDPIVTIAAACLLHWWNPEGPERVSLDTSGFWLRIAVGLAYQVGLHREPVKKADAGLRRRIWWSLVVRDCLINAGHGRPRAIDLKLTDVSPPTAHDFEGDTARANLFSSYVTISSILGDLTQSFLTKSGFQDQRSQIENHLYRWLKTLPDSLHLCRPEHGRLLKQYNFESRQLHVQYFTVLIIINRSRDSRGPPSTASLLASSFLAGIFEDFLARDELRYLGPIFTFYLLVAGMAQLSCYRYTGLWDAAAKDLDVMFRALDELAKRWPSAVGSLRHLTDVRDKIVMRPTALPHFPHHNLTPERLQFFEDFGPELCRMWVAIHEGHRDGIQRIHPSREIETAGILQGLRTPVTMLEGLGVDGADGELNDEREESECTNGGRDGVYGYGGRRDELGHAFGGGMAGLGYETALMQPTADLMTQYEGIGNWLLIDWDQGLG
ncbi:uncharacterized protein BDZ99DRAFT_456266 [Mytilinidion resinicola]|uniref:Zn(2)-C6 fungal-type domain-containing protein n=1 Tax=Mytilinidion resinicola TaxID=574789 RepID=A0A6A6XZ08_9PEZI|nr:uncharacterized protein BDZ99DRAFT_456266 [Mytilinidion resinicola]KAF2801493.1 hypothetical protein BDZ99DRAFT_456266 [Mytilinidion resinicola]